MEPRASVGTPFELPLRYDPRFVRELPGDPHSDPRPRAVLGALWSRVWPAPVRAPRLLICAESLAAVLGISPAQLADPAFAEVFAGNRLLTGMEPYASNYGGHQFGVWAGQLGDGRAITIAEVIARDGDRYELQLKGAGPTPYARHADGRAVLRSSVREFVCSEAMYALGVPTTRALCLIATGEEVIRDLFYDGRPAPEPGAIVCRVAPSFVRFGHFELPAARGEAELLERLLDFTLARDFPHRREPDPVARRGAWFIEVCERTAVLIAHWLRVGFVHGVMNTDNMSILGLTLDYGPFGFLEPFDPDFTPNLTDAHGRRYRFAYQAAIAEWNLGRLAAALATAIPDRAPLHEGLTRYRQRFLAEHQQMTAAKFGLPEWREEDRPWVHAAFDLMERLQLDYTGFFRTLGRVDPERPDPELFAAWSYRPFGADERAELLAWLQRWLRRLTADPEPHALKVARMRSLNPQFVPRNYLIQQAIDAATEGDTQPLQRLCQTLEQPYREDPNSPYAAKRPDWARDRPGCGVLSCSS